MRNISPVNDYWAKIGAYELNYIDHFASHNKEDGMKSVCYVPDADRVLKINYAKGLG